MFSILLILFCFGLIFGSFATVLIERWHSGRGDIVMGRSECPICRHILGWGDLIPLLSYIVTRGRCGYCHIHIPPFYPLSELLMGAIFAILGYAGLSLNIPIMSAEMLFLLLFGFVTGIYILYDLRYMEIPDQIMVPMIYILILIPIFSILLGGYTEYTFHTFHISISDRSLGAIYLYTFLYLQILIPGGYKLVQLKKWKLLRELIYTYFVFPMTILLDLIRGSLYNTQDHNDHIEIPTWVGGGDLRIALFIGLTLGTIHGIASFAIAYIVGSMVGILMLLIAYIRGKKISSQIPFGPFLGIGWITTIYYYDYIIVIYNAFFIYT